jgi:hypothetical protein
VRIWPKHGPELHWFGRYMTGNTPQLEAKAGEVTGLYLKRSAHAAMFCVKSAVQALDCFVPVLPLPPWRLERLGFEHYRFGTRSLHAAFNTNTSEVVGGAASRHAGAELVMFLGDIGAQQPKRKEIHVICDNLSAHKTRRANHLFADHPHVRMRNFPMHSLWVNQVELWFANTEHDVIARGISIAITYLKRTFVRYVREYGGAPRSEKRAPRNPAHRITSDWRITVPLV